MKFYLVDKYDNINTTAVLDSEVGLSGARTYFLGIKKIDEKEINQLIDQLVHKFQNLVRQRKLIYLIYIQYSLFLPF